MSVDDYTRLRMCWLDQVFEDEALVKGSAPNIAFVISKHFNRQRFSDSGIFSAWPSYATLAEKIGCTERTVQNAVRMLEARGHLKTKGKGGRHCTLTYFAVLKRPAVEEAQEQPEMTPQKGGNEFPRFEESEVAELEKRGNPTTETRKSENAKRRKQFPERPFLRNAMRNNKEKYRRMMRSLAKGILEGTIRLETVLDQLGNVAQGDVIDEIIGMKSPPNAPSTIAKKGDDDPLVDTGAMEGAIRYKVEK